jgi:hypothetical protein
VSTGLGVGGFGVGFGVGFLGADLGTAFICLMCCFKKSL